LVTLGTTGQTYFAFTLTALTEAQKITSFTLAATGTGLITNDLSNVALYADSGGVPAATPFASASQMTCAANSCTKTWTATDNVFPAAIQPGAPQTYYVKANVNPENVSKLGDDFRFAITATTSIVCKGAYTGTAGTVSGTAKATGKTYIVPFTVAIEGITPTSGSSSQQTITTGSTLGRFKLTNNGSALITLTNVTLTDNGSNSTTSEAYWLYASSENSADYTTNLLDNATNSVAFAGLGSTVTLNGGAYRYLTVIAKNAGGVTTGDSFNLAVSALGNVLYSVLEANLGYDAEADGDLTGNITGLRVSGVPSLGTYVAL
jgi:hypothetical protein